MGIKRVVVFVLALTVVVAAVVLNKKEPSVKSTTLHVYTWSNYYPEAILEDFKKKTGIQVELSYFSSSEELFSKLKAGATGYDIIQPSDYMIRQMARLDMLTPIDHQKLKNLANIEDFYRNPAYDPGLKFSVPFSWGTTGIAVNTELVDLKSDDISWSFLFESPSPKQTALLDDMREVFAGVLAWKGHPINSRDPNELGEAKKIISQVRSKILTFNSETKGMLLKGEVAIAHAWSVDALQAASENPKIKYLIPKEGGTIWADTFAIPKTSKHSGEAHAFIDYFLDADNALRMIRENHLTLPNKAAKLKLTPEELSNPNQYPSPAVMEKLHFLEDLGDTLPVMNNLWTELKS